MPMAVAGGRFVWRAVADGLRDAMDPRLRNIPCGIFDENLTPFGAAQDRPVPLSIWTMERGDVGAASSGRPLWAPGLRPDSARLGDHKGRPYDRE